ncbi:hypothetical protein ACFQJC_15680 [Haloferax namakaokahaiae]|uniref:ABC transporter ATP-binding protein n=1 Tax=Haloferax namakaokahaiae TaxID=1748331 RepID=A0ABD5ZI63_9EURY
MTSTGTTDSPTVSDPLDPSRRPPFLAVVSPRVAEAAAVATTVLPGVTPVIHAPHPTAPSRLRATLASIRSEDRPLVVATDSAAIARDADRIIVTDGGDILEDGTPDELLALPSVYAQLYSDEIGANFVGPAPDIADE